jgi:hypothetical protein
MTSLQDFPDRITFLEGLRPGNVFAGEPPLPRGLLAQMEGSSHTANQDPHPEQGNNPGNNEQPGCTAAERTILTLGFLDGLAEEMGGFGY